MIKNIGASNKLLLPNGKPLKVGSEIKVSDSILSSAIIRKLISEGKVQVRPVSLKNTATELAEAVTSIVTTVAASTVNPAAAVLNIVESVSEVVDAIEAVSDVISDASSLTILPEDTITADSKSKPRKRTSLARKEDGADNA